MKRQLTERAAWLRIASWYDKPKDMGGYFTNSKGICGICSCVDELMSVGSITQETFATMLSKIDTEVYKARLLSGDFLYDNCKKSSCTRRAALCRKFAKQLEKKVTKKKVTNAKNKP